MRNLALVLLLVGCTEADIAPSTSRPPPSAPLALEVPPLRGGGTHVLKVTGAQWGSTVSVALTTSTGAPGICPAPLAPTCLSIGGALRHVGTAVADYNGEARVTLAIPEIPNPVQVALQAVARDTGYVEVTPRLGRVVENQRPAWDTWQWGADMSDVIGCDPAGTTMTIDVRTNNWGYDTELYMADTRFTQDWGELHTLDEVDTSPSSRGYSRFERTLDPDVSYPPIPDQGTLFSCDNVDPSTSDFMVTAAILVRDSSAQIADCVVFGHDPDDLLGTPPPGLTPPPWLNDTNCRAWP